MNEFKVLDEGEVLDFTVNFERTRAIPIQQHLFGWNIQIERCAACISYRKHVNTESKWHEMREKETNVLERGQDIV